MDWRREADEDELKQLQEQTEEEMPRGWRPSPETIEALQNPKVNDANDLAEVRLDTAAERLEQIDWLKQETWSQLDEYQRRVALDLAGRELADVYHCPKPPVLFTDAKDPDLRGAYSDDDYYIQVNRAAELDRAKLLGDDATEALRAYAHEFRHSYQVEQKTIYEKPQFLHSVDDAEAAAEWSKNLRDYKKAKDDYQAYYDQPVERDARDFAEELVRRVYR